MDAAPKIVVVGLGYVGLPLAVAFAERFDTVGLDIDAGRVAELERHHDRTNEIAPERLAASRLVLASSPERIAPADVYIIAVPTPVDVANAPDLSILARATWTVGTMLDVTRRPIVCYESTVYPGVTEDVCGPMLEAASGLKRAHDFFLGYSPERINPGDREHTIDRLMKVVAGENPDVTARLSAIYGTITNGGTYEAPSIKVAEAAKVIENAQRDINIAFMNEIAKVLSALNISVWDVLSVAKTKWNFLPFEPGLVGGHCIGVDPYYLAHSAVEMGHNPAMILLGRAINDEMSVWLAERVSALLAPGAAVLVLGLTFKEDVPDLRNSKVVDVIGCLRVLGHRVDVADPLASAAEAEHCYGLTLIEAPVYGTYDAVMVAVPHESYRTLGGKGAARYLRGGGLLVDLKGRFTPDDVPEGMRYWRL